MIKIRVYTHSDKDSDMAIFERSDIRIIHISEDDFIEYSDFDVIINSLTEFSYLLRERNEYLDLEEVYEFDCTREYDEDYELWFSIDNPKNVTIEYHRNSLLSDLLN